MIPYKTGVDWPGGDPRGEWTALFDAISVMKVGQCIAVEIANPSKIDAARRAAGKFAEKNLFKKQGLILQTTRREKTLYIRKMAIGAE